MVHPLFTVWQPQPRPRLLGDADPIIRFPEDRRRKGGMGGEAENCELERNPWTPAPINGHKSEPQPASSTAPTAKPAPDSRTSGSPDDPALNPGSSSRQSPPLIAHFERLASLGTFYNKHCSHRFVFILEDENKQVYGGCFHCCEEARIPQNWVPNAILFYHG